MKIKDIVEMSKDASTKDKIMMGMSYGQNIDFHPIEKFKKWLKKLKIKTRSLFT